MKKKASSLLAIFGMALTTICYAYPETLSPLAPYKPDFHRLTTTTSILPPNGELIDLLPQLKQRALTGDASAASAIYAGLATCDTSVRYNDKDKLSAYCQGVSDNELHDSGRWLALAASLGDARAQYNYAAGGIDTVLSEPLEALKNPGSVKQYRALARGYLDGLARQCNVDAIAIIVSEASTNGLVYAADPALAYKYESVLNFVRKTPDVAAERILESKVDPLQVFSLKSEAVSFVDSYCK